MSKSSEKILYEELARCYDDPLRFVLWAFPWGETPETSLVKLKSPWKERYPNCEYGPDRWACEFLDDLGAEVKARGFDGTHAVDPIRMAVSSGHGIGKALKNSTIVDTPAGKRVWGELKVGDYLWGPDGKPTKIIAIPYRGIRDLYRVTFDDGAYVDCSGEHLWTVRGRQQRRKRSFSWLTLTTEEIMRKGATRPNGRASARQWEIPKQSPVALPEAALPLDPYLFGLYLGNGCGTASSLRLTVSSQGVLDQIDGVHGLCNCTLHYHDNFVTVGLKDCAGQLKATGAHGCGSDKKFIPEKYKLASVEQRSELFRGLVDSDGEVTKHGSLVYSTVSRRLCDDVIWLARSLGGKAQRQPSVKKTWYKDSSGSKVKCKDCYRVTITMPRGFVCGYHTERVGKIKRTIEDRYITRWIDKIEPIGSGECMCVTVDREDGLFLANDFIVTHNSAMSAWLVCWIMATRPNCKGVVTANTANQLETKTWAEIRKWLKRSLVADMFEIKAMSIEAKGSAETWRVDALTCREENAEAFAGLHAASATPFYLFDEASAIPEKIYEVAEGGLTDGEPMMFLFGNPTRSSGTFHACFHNRKKRDHWKLRTIDSRTVDVTNKEQLARWEEEYGEESDFFRVRVRGLFPNVSSQQFIPTGLITAATERPALNNHPNVAVIGVDVARYGDDDTVIFFRFGRDGSYPYRKYSGLSTTQVVARVKEAIRDAQLLGFKKVYCFIDEGGVGGGPVDILRDDGFEQVRGVNFGWSADDPKSWNRKRDEMWGRMREWLKTATLKDDEDLATDLTAPEYEILLNGATKLESKEHMKKRGVSSPDIADALALTFAYQVQEYGTDMSEVCEDARKKRLEFNPFKTIGNWLS